ncbi:MAG: hypothetical protein ACI92O_000315 [Colwellia sp.]|jgi:hypothetical protein
MHIDKLTHIITRTFLFLTLFISTSVFSKDVYVDGYIRSDGTAVKGYYRSAPNSTINDNFSTEGNINPYTGEEGWVPRESIETSKLEWDNSSSSESSYNSNQQPNQSVSRSRPSDTDYDLSFSDIYNNPFKAFIFMMIGFAVVCAIIIEPYEQFIEFCRGPGAYRRKHGTSEVFWNFLRGLGSLGTLIVIIVLSFTKLF